MHTRVNKCDLSYPHWHKYLRAVVRKYSSISQPFGFKHLVDHPANLVGLFDRDQFPCKTKELDTPVLWSDFYTPSHVFLNAASVVSRNHSLGVAGRRLVAAMPIEAGCDTRHASLAPASANASGKTFQILPDWIPPHSVFRLRCRPNPRTWISNKLPGIVRVPLVLSPSPAEISISIPQIEKPVRMSGVVSVSLSCAQTL